MNLSDHHPEEDVSDNGLKIELIAPMLKINPKKGDYVVSPQGMRMVVDKVTDHTQCTCIAGRRLRGNLNHCFVFRREYYGLD
jgi:hypothetical protein